MQESDFHLNADEAEAIRRLSALETLREQARSGNRASMVASVEKLIQAELRTLHRIRSSKNEHAGSDGE